MIDAAWHLWMLLIVSTCTHITVAGCSYDKLAKKAATIWPRKDLRRHLIKYALKFFESHFDVTVAMQEKSCYVLPRVLQGMTSGVSKIIFASCRMP